MPHLIRHPEKLASRIKMDPGLRLDAISGLIVALVLIPQSMAYAQLAGLPAY